MRKACTYVSYDFEHWLPASCDSFRRDGWAKLAATTAPGWDGAGDDPGGNLGECVRPILSSC